MGLSYLLRPLSVLYGGVTDVRNALYNYDIFARFRPTQYVISIGNVAVGGTGKTPMVEYLLRGLLHHQPAETLATLSRGYGRQTNGFRWVGPTDVAQTVGDEPLQLYRKFGPQHVAVAVGERRADALYRIAGERPLINTVLLDDAFQHRAVWPHLNILLTDYARPFFRDHPFPEGRLRERRFGVARADAVVVTKCPATVPAAEQETYRNGIQRYAGADTPVFFAGLRYDAPVSYRDNVAMGATLLRDVWLMTGLANPLPVERYVAGQFGLAGHRRFADHHAYTRADVLETLRIAQGAPILTTEKDWVKLSALLQPDEAAQFYYVPVAVTLLHNEAAFWALVNKKRPVAA